MSLSAEQQAMLKADVEADPAFAAVPQNPDGAFEIAAVYNLTAAPDFYVWRSDISPAEYREAIVWAEVDALQAGDARTWEWVTQNMTAPLDASKANIRQGIADVWAANSATRPALLTIAKRLASRVEKLLASGTGSSASPATMGFEGPLSYRDVEQAMGW